MSPLLHCNSSFSLFMLSSFFSFIPPTTYALALRGPVCGCAHAWQAFGWLICESMVRSDRREVASLWNLRFYRTTHIPCVRRGKNGAGALVKVHTHMGGEGGTRAIVQYIHRLKINMCSRQDHTLYFHAFLFYSNSLALFYLSVWPLSLPCLFISSPNTHIHACTLCTCSALTNIVPVWWLIRSLSRIKHCKTDSADINFNDLSLTLSLSLSLHTHTHPHTLIQVTAWRVEK